MAPTREGWREMKGAPAGPEDWASRASAAYAAVAGWPGLPEQVGATLCGGMTPADQVALDGLVGYFAKHIGRVGYYGRLRSG